MRLPLDIYVRVSDAREREEADGFASPEVQETACRAWLERNRLEEGEVVVEINVSGATKLRERELGRLVAKVEAGESGGIVAAHMSRFQRDEEIGGELLRRVTREASGRIVVADGSFDSDNLSAESEMVAHILMAVDAAIRRKNRDNWISGNERAAQRGVYLAARPPLGYVRRDQVEPRYTADGELIPDGVLVVDTAVALLVREAFERRAGGEPVSSIAEWLNREIGEKRITESGLRKVFAPNPSGARPYLGESTHQTKKKGQVAIIKGAHEPLVTEELFERVLAAAGTFHPRTGYIAAATHLLGIAHCASCGQQLHGSGGGKRRRIAYYGCTGPVDCPARAFVSAEKLNEHVWQALTEAVSNGHPGVTAVIDGGDDYFAAQAAIEDAKEELALYTKHTSIRAVGEDAYAIGLAARQAAVELARKQFQKATAPRREGALHGEMFGLALSEGGVLVNTLEPGAMRDVLRLLVRRVEVGPSSRTGPRPSVADRTKVTFRGAS